MLKRENDFEKNDKMESFKNKYNLEELFENIVLNKEEEEKKVDKKEKTQKKKA